MFLTGTNLFFSLKMEYGGRLLTVLVPRPFLDQVIFVRIFKNQLVHMSFMLAGEVGGVDEIKIEDAVFRIVAFQAHARLIIARAIVRAKQLVPVEVVYREH